jgi:hypothetical protein
VAADNVLCRISALNVQDSRALRGKNDCQTNVMAVNAAYTGEQNPMTNNVTHDRIMQLAMGFWASKTLLSAVEIGVFGAFAGPHSI